jgi:hypothetical protein
VINIKSNQKGTKMKVSKKTYRVSYKHKEYGSDTLGHDFATVASATRAIELLRTNPGQMGYCEWLREATLWVVDSKGNVY